jgi:methylphosphotriester-DNA--protein-cysteine methyltransferase
LYGRLDCPAALRAIARGGYVKNRVFFADEKIAVSAGFRPCAVCLPERYARWKVAKGQVVDKRQQLLAARARSRPVRHT